MFDKNNYSDDVIKHLEEREYYINRIKTHCEESIEHDSTWYEFSHLCKLLLQRGDKWFADKDFLKKL